LAHLAFHRAAHLRVRASLTSRTRASVTACRFRVPVTLACGPQHPVASSSRKQLKITATAPAEIALGTANPALGLRVGHFPGTLLVSRLPPRTWALAGSNKSLDPRKFGLQQTAISSPRCSPGGSRGPVAAYIINRWATVTKHRTLTSVISTRAWLGWRHKQIGLGDFKDSPPPPALLATSPLGTRLGSQRPSQTHTAHNRVLLVQD
jgi:hypothetical protein